MFVSIVIDPVSDDSKNKISKVIKEYGFKKVQENLYESFDFQTKKLGNIKKDLSDCIDMDDKLRIYQFPLEKSFKISYVEERKWKRLSITEDE